MPFHILTFISRHNKVQQRDILCLMVCIGVVNSYILRSSLHISITEVAEREDLNSICVTYNNTEGTKYKWNEHQQGGVLSSFLLGYTLTHIPGSIVTTKCGGYYIFAVGLLISALLTIIVPIVLQYGGSWYSFCGIRFVIGLSQGPLFSSVSNILAKWVPKDEQRRAGLLVYVGPHVGNIIAYAGTPLLMLLGQNWEFSYYFWGGSAMIWFILFIVLCYANPATHPRVTPEEKLLLNRVTAPPPRFRPPWRRILYDRKTLGVIFGWVGHSLTYFYINVNLPKYLKEIHTFNVVQNGLINSTFYVCVAFSLCITTTLGRNISDSVLNFRRLFMIVGNLVPCACLLSAAYFECDRHIAPVLFVVGGLVMGPTYVATRSSVFDLTYNFSGIVTALANGVGTLSYIAIPNAIAEATKSNNFDEWKMVFSAFMVATACLTLISILTCSHDRAKWDMDVISK